MIRRPTRQFNEVSTMAGFVKAVRSQRKFRAAFDGPAGAGKTYTALRLAFSLIRAGMAKRLAVIDTENNSASLYAGENPDGDQWLFDTMPLTKFGPDNFTNGLNLAVKEGYDVVLIDSLSHAWIGAGGALDLVDQKGGNKFTAWKDITPMQRRMMDTMIQSPAHVLVTMRSKTEYVLEEDANGKKVPKKIGMAPQQRDGMEFEFDVYSSIDATGQLKVTKTRCSALHNATTMHAGPAFWQPAFDWLNSAATAPEMATKTEPASTGEPTPSHISDIFNAPGHEIGQDDNSLAIENSFPVRIKNAQTQTALEAIAEELIAERKAGRVSDSELAVSRAEYKTRLTSFLLPN